MATFGIQPFCALILLLATLPTIASADPEQTAATKTEDQATSDEDSSPKVIKLDVWILELAGEFDPKTLPKNDEQKILFFEKLKKSSLLRHHHHLSSTTLEGKEMMIHVGSRQPQVAGVTVTGRGRQTRITYQDVGMMLTAICVATPDDMINSEVQIEQTNLDKSDVPIDEDTEGNRVNADQVESLIVQSTVQSHSGAMVQVAGSAIKLDNGQQQVALVLLSATILE